MDDVKKGRAIGILPYVTSEISCHSFLHTATLSQRMILLIQRLSPETFPRSADDEDL